MADLADEIGSSPTTCWRRVRAMEEEGILGATVRQVDHRKVNCGLDVFCQVRMRAHDRASRETFQHMLEAVPHIIAAYATSGDCDYLLHCLVGSIDEYQKILTDSILACSAVASSATLFALSRVKHTNIVPIG